MYDGCENPAHPKDKDSVCYECDGSNCNSNCRNLFHWNLCDDCFQEECGDDEESESEDEIEDQDDFTNRSCGWRDCNKDFDLADPHYYDEESSDCYCSEECFKKYQDESESEDEECCDECGRTEKNCETEMGLSTYNCQTLCPDCIPCDDEDEPDEPEKTDVVRKIEFEGKKYFKSKITGAIYNMDQELIGKWNEVTNTIDFDSEDEDEDEDEA